MKLDDDYIQALAAELASMPKLDPRMVAQRTPVGETSTETYHQKIQAAGGRITTVVETAQDVADVTHLVDVGQYHHRSAAINDAIAHLVAECARRGGPQAEPGSTTFTLSKELTDVIQGLSVEGGGLEFEDVLEFAVLYMQQELKEGKNLLQLED